MRVALLDSGVRRSHCVFDEAAIEDGKNYIASSAASGLPGAEYGTRDYLGHGTFIASMLIRLVPDAVIVPLRCFDGETASAALLAQAIYDAADLFDCDILHMSWGIPYEDEALHEAIRYAKTRGVLLVASAGNDGNDGLWFPAAWPEVVSVGALDENGEPASFSQTGPAVDIYAPGTNLPGAGHTSDRAEAVRSGTSYAAAFVSAFAVMVRQEDAEFSQADFTALIRHLSGNRLILPY